MKLSRLEQVNEYDFQQWLENALELNAYQRLKLNKEELLHFSHFYFYKVRKQQKVSFLWRLTLPFLPIYILVLIVFNPLKWMITGKWGYNQKFLDHYNNWLHKLNLS